MVTLQDFGGSETVPANLQENALQTIKIINEIFAAFPANTFRFTSGYRSPSHNAAVGGVSNSYHIIALAGDFVPNDGSPSRYEAKVAQICSKYGYEFMYHEISSGKHFHIEPKPQKKKK